MKPVMMKRGLTLVLLSLVVACSSDPKETKAEGAVPSTGSTEAPHVGVAPASTSARVDLHPNLVRANAAASALSKMRTLVALGKTPGLGVASASAVDAATLGPELPVYYVDGDVLSKDRPDADPHAALGEANEVAYPVIVDGVVTSVVTLSRMKSGAWEVASLGRANLARSIESTGAFGAKSTMASVGLVEVHELGLHMLAHEDGEGLKLRILGDAAGGDPPAGESLPVHGAFARLATRVQEHRAAYR